MLNFDPTEITADEKATVLAANSTSVRTVTEAPEGYVKGTWVAKALNEALKAAGFEDRTIPSQMVYNYAKKGTGGLTTKETVTVVEEDENGESVEVERTIDTYPHIREDVALTWVRKQYIVRTATEETDEVEADEAETEETVS